MILIPEKPVEELQKDFKDELTSQMKKAALKLKCPVEHLKYRVGNDGVVEIAMMDAQELVELQAKEAEDSKNKGNKGEA